MGTWKRRKKIVGMVKGMVMCVTVFSFVFGGGVSLWGQETNKPSTFVEELSSLLGDRGWTEEEVSRLVDAAKELNWEGAEDAGPEVVALALEFGKKEEADMEPLEQAQLALELALTAVEMESMGYDERSVARVALNGVRDMLSEIQSWREGGGEGNLGEMIRNRLSNEVRSMAMVQVHERARDKAQEQSGGVSETGFSQIPSDVSSGVSEQPGYNQGKP